MTWLQNNIGRAQGGADRPGDRQGRLHLRRLRRPRGAGRARSTGSGKWVGPAFYTMATASVGFQAGVSVSENVTLVMTEKGLNSLLTNSVKLGADASVAAGPVGAGAKSDIVADLVTFSRAKGVYGGLNLDGTVVAPCQRLEQRVLRQGRAAAGHPDPHDGAQQAGGSRCCAQVTKADARSNDAVIRQRTARRAPRGALSRFARARCTRCPARAARLLAKWRHCRPLVISRSRKAAMVLKSSAMPEHSLRFLLNGDPVEVTAALGADDAARIPARGARTHRHQGRLRGGRLRRLHGGPGRAGWRRAASRGSPSMRAFACLLPSPARRSSPSRACNRRTAHCIRCSARWSNVTGRSAASARPGFAMSLFGLYKNAHAARRARRSTMRCRAIFAAAPATARFSPRRSGCTRSTATRASGWRGPGHRGRRQPPGQRRRGTDRCAARPSLAAPAAWTTKPTAASWLAPRTRRRAGGGLRGASVGAHRRRRHRRRSVGHQAASRPGRHHLCRRLRRTEERFATPAMRWKSAPACIAQPRHSRRSTATGRSCTRRGFALRRCRSATAARWAATSPTVRRSAIRCPR